MSTPGQRLRAERTANGWTQQKLADAISRIKREKISRAAVALWESGDSKTQKPENFFAAAQALGLEPQWLLNGAGSKYVNAAQPAQPAQPAQHPVATEHRRISLAATRLTDEEGMMVEAYRLADDRLRRIMLASAREVIHSFGRRSEANGQ